MYNDLFTREEKYEYDKIIQIAVSHLPKSENIFANCDIDYSNFSNQDFFFVIDNLVRDILNYNRKNRITKLTEEKMKYFFKVFEKIENENLKEEIFIYVVLKYEFTNETFSINEWKTYYEKYLGEINVESA